MARDVVEVLVETDILEALTFGHGHAGATTHKSKLGPFDP